MASFYPVTTEPSNGRQCRVTATTARSAPPCDRSAGGMRRLVGRSQVATSVVIVAVPVATVGMAGRSPGARSFGADRLTIRT